MSRTAPASPNACMPQAALEASLAHCRAVARARAKNFYSGMRIIPEPLRSATCVLYAWMRQADDLADEPGDLAEKARRLEQFSAQTRCIIAPEPPGPEHLPADTLWPAFRDLALHHQLSGADLQDLINGQLLDLHKFTYDTFDELYDYCYKVAGVVGLLCIQIWGYEGGAQTRQLAEWRGIAFQLTNILRDVREDSSRGRSYLPADLFDGQSPTPSAIVAGPAPEIVAGLTRLAAKAREYYEASAPLDGQVNPAARPCLRAMTQIYQTLLSRIERDPAVVLREPRVRLSRWSKLRIALQAMWKR